MFIQTYRATILLLVSLLTFNACQSDTKMDNEAIITLKSPQYSAFQWAVLAQGKLILTAHKGWLWPAYQSDNAILESYPPQIRLNLHNDDSVVTIAIDTLYSPLEVTSDNSKAEILVDGLWQSVADFKLNDMQFQYKFESGQQWRDVSSANIRFSEPN
ncbi:hypothetical protein [uncultured Paraglaciecola sp.]|uniref:hypothetical protein n=1 Tax=uncultured Paraglaciecola sp. TaxID=1765024 RepID=UPI0026070A8B|nr:hypothetical protein [uncultured Paraglaciecola sp.]